MHWLHLPIRGVDLYTTHNSLVFLYDPTWIVANLFLTTLQTVLRCAVRLSPYSYTCIHVPETENVWANFLSEWTALRIILRLVSVPVLPSSSNPDFIWPSHESFENPQKQFEDSKPSKTRLRKDGLLRVQDSALWIPEKGSELQL